VVSGRDAGDQDIACGDLRADSSGCLRSNRTGTEILLDVALLRDGDYTTPAGHWANPIVNFEGLQTAFNLLDAAYAEDCIRRGAPVKPFPAVITLDIPPSKPEWTAYIKDRLASGSELAVTGNGNTAAICQALGVDPKTVVTKGLDWWSEKTPEVTARGVAEGIKAQFGACLAGDSLRGETVDLGHNWEGRPFFPYYVQVRPDQPHLSAMPNRELRESNAPLELFWLTKSPWADYDRPDWTYSFHLSDVLLFSELCPPGAGKTAGRSDALSFGAGLAADHQQPIPAMVCGEMAITCRSQPINLVQ